MAPTDRSLLVADEQGAVQRLQVLEETGATRRAPTPKGYSDPWVVLFIPGLLRAATVEGITRTELRVWLAVLAHSSVETAEFDSQPAVLAAALGMDPKTVIRSVTQLVAYGLLLRPRRGKLALAPEIAWRGGSTTREAALKTRKDQA